MLCLSDRPAFDRHHNISWAALPDNFNNSLPINHSVAAGAPYGRAGDLSALGAGLLDRDILGMQVHQSFSHSLQPSIRILSAEEGVTGIEIYANARAPHQLISPV